MKTIITTVALFATLVAATSQIARNPSVSEQFASNLVAISSQRYVILQEGVSVDGTQDNYFAVAIPGHPDGGTILHVKGVNTGGSVLGWGTVTVYDLLDTRKGWYVPVGYVGGPFLQTDGGFDMYGQHITISLRFAGEGAFPSVCVTWGTQSYAHDVGYINDDLRQVIVRDHIPQRQVELQTITNDADVPDGVYVFAEYIDETYVLQSSTDLIQWVDEPSPFYFYGSIGCHYFPLPSSGNEKKFFRTKEKT